MVLRYAPPKQRHVQGEIAPHGTPTRYVQHKCRCPDCREAIRKKEAQNAKLRGYFDVVSDWEDGLVDAAGARAQLHRVTAAGIPFNQLEAVTGVGHTALHEIKTGRRTRVFPATQDAIMAISWRRLFEVAPANTPVPAAPSWRLLDELIAAGWPKSWIAGQLGHGRALQLSRSAIQMRHARAIKALHDRLWRDDAVGVRYCGRGRFSPGRRMREVCECSWSDDYADYPPLGERVVTQPDPQRPCDRCRPNRLCAQHARERLEADQARLEQLRQRIHRNPPPPNSCCMGRNCPTDAAGSRVDCSRQAGVAS